MEWLTAIKSTIDYIESHIKEDIKIDNLANNVYVSSYYLQTGFQIMTGYSIGEYIRNRKLYLAAIDLLQDKKVIDVALDYGYETPEAFTKAFKRFHGFLPSKIKVNKVKVFNSLTIDIRIRGGELMDLNYKITDMFPLKLIGFMREFDMVDSYKKIPLFWDEICEKYCYPHIYRGLPATNDYEKAIIDNCIGEYGVCIECHGTKFKYLIAGKYCGGKVPEGMMLYEFPAGK
jgi:AraC family transcriptional regulator